jgi:transposase-like protein
MARRKQLTDEQKQQAIGLRQQGLTYPQIAKRIGTNKTSIQRIVANVEVRPTSTKPKPGRKPKATNGHAAPEPAAVEPSTRVAWSPFEPGVEALRRELAEVRGERNDLRRLLGRMLRKGEA